MIQIDDVRLVNTQGISDMFALSALLPDKTRMYREYNEMKVKYQDNLLQLTRLQDELDKHRSDALATETRLKAALADALATRDGSGTKALAAEAKIREIHELRLQDADVAMKAVESATRRADVSEKRLRGVEERLRSHPAVQREGLSQVDLESLLPQLLTRTDEKLERALDSENKLQESHRSMDLVLKELEDTQKEARSQAGNVGRFNAEMDSLKAKLARTEADLQALQIEHDIVWKNKEDVAKEAEDIAMSTEREFAKHEAQLKELQQLHEDAQERIKQMASAEAAMSASASESKKKHVHDKELLLREAVEMRKRECELETALKDHVRACEREQERATSIEERLAESVATCSSLHSRVTEAEAAVRRVKIEKQQDIEEKDKELQRLRATHSDGSRAAREAAEHATQRISTLEKLLSSTREEANSVKMDAQREVASIQRQLKESEYKLKEAQDEAAHSDRMHHLAQNEAEDVRKQVVEVRTELQSVRSQARGHEEKIKSLEAALSSNDATIDRHTEQLQREHAQEMERLEEHLQSLQETKRRAEGDLAREVQHRHADKQMAADQLKCDIAEERMRGEHELEALKRRHAEELESQAAAHRRALGEVESLMQRERLAAQANVLEVEEMLRENVVKRHELEEEVPRLRRELESLRPLQQNRAELQKDLSAKERELARLRQEIDSGKMHINFLWMFMILQAAGCLYWSSIIDRATVAEF